MTLTELFDGVQSDYVVVVEPRTELVSNREELEDCAINNVYFYQIPANSLQSPSKVKFSIIGDNGPNGYYETCYTLSHSDSTNHMLLVSI